MIEPAEQQEDRRAVYLVQQYEILKKDVRALDAVYLKVTLLYLTISGALIASNSIWAQSEHLTKLAVLLPLLCCLCVLGVIYRVRKLIDHREQLLRRLEIRLQFEHMGEPSGIAAFRTSSFLAVLVIFVTLMICGLILRAS